MRAEQWIRIYQEIRQESATYPNYSPGKGFNQASPWAWIIPDSRFGVSVGARTDWWQRDFLILERVLSTKPYAKAPNAPPAGQIPAPALPSFQGVHGHLSNAAAGSFAAASASPDGGTKRLREEPGPWAKAPPAKKGPSQPCWFCGSPKHWSNQCPHQASWRAQSSAAKPNANGRQGKGKGGGKNQGKGGKGGSSGKGGKPSSK